MAYIDICSLSRCRAYFNTNRRKASRWSLLTILDFSWKCRDNLLQSSRVYAILAHSVQHSGAHNVVIIVGSVEKRCRIEERETKPPKKATGHGLGRTGERLAAEELMRAGYR